MNTFLLHSANGQHLSVSAKKPPSENKASANSPDMAIHTNFPKTMGEIQKASRDQLAHWGIAANRLALRQRRRKFAIASPSD
jgi:hypothetical protein